LNEEKPFFALQGGKAVTRNIGGIYMIVGMNEADGQGAEESLTQQFLRGRLGEASADLRDFLCEAQLPWKLIPPCGMIHVRLRRPPQGESDDLPGGCPEQILFTNGHVSMLHGGREILPNERGFYTAAADLCIFGASCGVICDFWPTGTLGLRDCYQPARYLVGVNTPIEAIRRLQAEMALVFPEETTTLFTTFFTRGG
jgi:hypothetical protein